jgi:hypothetical protein
MGEQPHFTAEIGVRVITRPAIAPGRRRASATPPHAPQRELFHSALARLQAAPGFGNQRAAAESPGGGEAPSSPREKGTPCAAADGDPAADCDASGGGGSPNGVAAAAHAAGPPLGVGRAPSGAVDDSGSTDGGSSRRGSSAGESDRGASPSDASALRARGAAAALEASEDGRALLLGHMGLHPQDLSRIGAALGRAPLLRKLVLAGLWKREEGKGRRALS